MAASPSPHLACKILRSGVRLRAYGNPAALALASGLLFCCVGTHSLKEWDDKHECATTVPHAVYNLGNPEGKMCVNVGVYDYKTVTILRSYLELLRVGGFVEDGAVA